MQEIEATDLFVQRNCCSAAMLIMHGLSKNTAMPPLQQICTQNKQAGQSRRDMTVASNLSRISADEGLGTVAAAKTGLKTRAGFCKVNRGLKVDADQEITI